MLFHMSNSNTKMNPFRLLTWLIVMVFISFLSGCDLELEEPDLNDLRIQADHHFDIEPGPYAIEYAIPDLNRYSSTYDIDVLIEAFDQNGEPALIVDETIIVHEGDAYDVTIVVFDHVNERIITEKTIVLTARFPVALSVWTPPDRTVYDEGDFFDPTGLVLSLLYSDGHEQVIDDYVCKTDPLTIDDASFSIVYENLETHIDLEITEHTVEYVIDFGEIRDPLVLSAPFLRDIPEVHIPGANVIGLYESPDFSGDPIAFPHIPMNEQSVTLYAELDASIHRVTFNVTEGFDRVGGGPLEQYVVYGQRLEDPPVLFHEDYHVIGWTEELSRIERDLELFPLYAGIVVTKDQNISGVNMAYRITVHAPDLQTEINLRVDEWGYDFVACAPDTTYVIEENTTISLRVEHRGEWIDLDDVAIDDIDHSRPVKPTVSYYADPDHPENLLAILYRGEKPVGSTASISHTTYRLDHGETWETFTGSYHVLSLPNQTIIELETYDSNDIPSRRLTISATLETSVYAIGEKQTLRHVLQTTEYFLSGNKRIRTNLIGNIEEIRGILDYGVFEDFYPYTTGSDYIGCGPKAAEIFLGWFGSDKTQSVLVGDNYVRTQSVSFFSGIFTTPAQLESGITRTLREYGFNDYDVHHQKTHTTDPSIDFIESYLEKGFPVVILVDGGNHYQVISSSVVTWSEGGTVLHAEFVLHDNGGRRIKTWPELDYFFEDQWHAVSARALGYTSYRNMILSIEILEEA